MSTLSIGGDDLIDLQTHTIYSDGHWQPAALMAHLAGAGFRVAAVTDHDQMDHIDEVVALGQAAGVHIIPAVEVTTTWRGRVAHLLCYAARFTGDALHDLTCATNDRQRANTLAVYQELVRRGYRFPRQGEVLPDRGGLPAHPTDNSKLLRAHGYAKTHAEDLALLRDAGFVSVTAGLAEAVAAAQASGGVAVLGHPGRSGGEFTPYDAALLDDLRAEIPLDGLEVYYPLHSPEQVRAFEAYTAAHGLLRSAGSDSHGPRQRLPIAYPAALAGGLLARCGVDVE
ncbi:MAG TPA: PHP domain-containing protein [Ktedonobacterales bacterium]